MCQLERLAESSAELWRCQERPGLQCRPLRGVVAHSCGYVTRRPQHFNATNTMGAYPGHVDHKKGWYQRGAASCVARDNQCLYFTGNAPAGNAAVVAEKIQEWYLPVRFTTSMKTDKLTPKIAEHAKNPKFEPLGAISGRLLHIFGVGRARTANLE